MYWRAELLLSRPCSSKISPLSLICRTDASRRLRVTLVARVGVGVGVGFSVSLPVMFLLCWRPASPALDSSCSNFQMAFCVEMIWRTEHEHHEPGVCPQLKCFLSVRTLLTLFWVAVSFLEQQHLLVQVFNPSRQLILQLCNTKGRSEKPEYMNKKNSGGFYRQLLLFTVCCFFEGARRS